METGSWERVLGLASTYGYAFLFLISVAENTFLVGLVVPGDAAVVLGGALASQARLSVSMVLLVVTAGVLMGANLSFWIGRRGGIPLVERWAERFSIDADQLRKVELYFSRHGAKTVFLASFVSGLKNLVPAVAGASRMGIGRFVVYNAAGSTLRGVVFVGIGYIFGANLTRAIETVGKVNGWLLGVVAGLLALALFAGWRRKRLREQTARQSGENREDRVDRQASP